MIELGKRDEIFGVLEPIKISGCPSKLPLLKEDEQLICGYDQGLGERLFVCETIEDALYLYNAYANGEALQISWYKGKDPGFIFVV